VRLDHEQHGPAAELVDEIESFFLFAHDDSLFKAAGGNSSKSAGEKQPFSFLVFAARPCYI
jgi:hypothetical protein